MKKIPALVTTQALIRDHTPQAGVTLWPFRYHTGGLCGTIACYTGREIDLNQRWSHLQSNTVVYDRNIADTPDAVAVGVILKLSVS